MAQPLPLRLLSHRKERGMTRAALANQLGISIPTLWNWERGKSKPRSQRLDIIEQVIATGTPELVFEEYDRPASDLESTAGSLAEIVRTVREQLAQQAGIDPAQVKIILEM